MAEFGVEAQLGQASAEGREKGLAVERDFGDGFAGSPFHEGRFELAARDGFDAEAAQKVGVDGSVEAVAGEACSRVETLGAVDDGQGEARGGVHRQVERDAVGFAERGFGERGHGEIDAGYGVSFAGEPGLGRGEAEGLMAEFIGGKEKDVHPTHQCRGNESIE